MENSKIWHNKILQEVFQTKPSAEFLELLTRVHFRERAFYSPCYFVIRLV